MDNHSMQEHFWQNFRSSEEFKRMVAQAAAKTAAEHRRHADRLAAAEAHFAKTSVKARAAVEAAETDVKAAQAVVDAALEKLRTVAQANSDLCENLQNTRRELEPHLRRLADPKIDEFIGELRQMLADGPGLYAFTFDPEGDRVTSDGRRGRDNAKQIDIRAHKILDGVDEAERLKMLPADDLEAAFDRIRKSIPQA